MNEFFKFGCDLKMEVIQTLGKIYYLRRYYK